MMHSLPEFRLRLWIAAIFVFIALLILWFSHAADSPSEIGRNIGSEVLGITITVAGVDWLFERRGQNAQRHKLAVRTLEELDHAIWVWQGGSRYFDHEEMIALLKQVTDDDPLPGFTQNLFLRIGGKAALNLVLESDLVNHDTNLKAGIDHLSHLCKLRDGDTPMPCQQVVLHSREAATCLLKVLSWKPVKWEPSAQRGRKDCSIEHQRWRYYGEPALPRGTVEAFVAAG